MASQPEPPGRPAREAPCQTAAMGGDAVSMWSAPTRGEDLAALQGLVQQKLGRCLIRLQQYELLIKDFVARARLEGPANSILKIQEARAATVAQQTLGQVVGALLGTVFVEPAWDEDGFPPTAAPSDEGVWINSGFTVSVSDEEFAAVKARMADLVALRNELVHGFVAQHDLQSEAGCRTAAAALDDSHEVIDRHVHELRDWYQGMLDLTQATGEMLTNPDFHDHFFPDMLPDDFAVAGSGSTIVELLRRAEAELSRDGWTLLDDAVAFVRRISPEHTPRGHGCSTWRQVLHEARPIFDVKRDAADSKRPGRTWYRTRPPQAIEPIPDIEA